MGLFLVGLGVLVLSGLAAFACRRWPAWATGFGAGGAVVGCTVALAPAVGALLGTGSCSLRAEWGMPFGSFFVELDPLSGLFLAPILAVSALAAIYGGEYLLTWRGRKPLGWAWCCFNLLVASMALVVVARNAVLFLIAWEAMSLFSFCLVAFEDEKKSVRDAARIYLIATHLGTAFIMALFLMLGERAGSLDFDRFRSLGAAPNGAGLLFLFAVIGFGTKAGFMPFHVWLPEAHPAAPSHVSAVMSGVMIKTGIYGLIRMLTFLGPPLMWWGWTLIGIGLVSGILGVLFALAQHDLKRLLAYHSVENIGIITLGLGVGVLGLSANLPVLAVLGFAGALLHVVNHAVFKGLLFLGAGAVLHGAGTLDMDHLGGLLKRMRSTGAYFLVGAMAIAGLPPLNGFVSEFLVYLGAIRGGALAGGRTAVAALGVVAGLTLIGGLAAACFAKAFGIVFLGEPRSSHAEHAHEVGPAMRLPMLVLAAGCVLIGLLAPVAVMAVGAVIPSVTGLRPTQVVEGLSTATGPLLYVAAGFIGLLVLALALALLRGWLLAGRKVETGLTWDCGYARPTPRMQYTSSSFAQPLIELFRPFLRTERKFARPDGLFPRHGALATDTPDLFVKQLYNRLFLGVQWSMSRLRPVQHGRVQLYVLYVAAALVLLLIWFLG